MGCATSAPNTISPNASTADKSIQLEEETKGNPSIEVDAADTEDEDRTNETKVLPTRDNNEEPVQLARNNKSSSSIVTAKEVPANGHTRISEIENVAVTSESTKEEVKIPKLELFMEKVFETNQHLIEADQKILESKLALYNPPHTKTEEEAEENNEDKDTSAEAEGDKPETEDENKTVEASQEAEEISPSQSQSSRATRWEALADIAAELPASLAVDPVTGQIYQIATKH